MIWNADELTLSWFDGEGRKHQLIAAPDGHECSVEHQINGQNAPLYDTPEQAWTEFVRRLRVAGLIPEVA